MKKEKYIIGIVGNTQLKEKKHSLIFHTNSATTISPNWTFSDSSVMTVNWGDNSPSTSHATTLSHTYTYSGTKKIKFTCPDWTTLTKFDFTDATMIGSMPSFKRCTNLGYIRIRGGELSSTPLENIDIGYQQPSLAYICIWNNLTSNAVDRIIGIIYTDRMIYTDSNPTLDLKDSSNDAPSSAGMWIINRLTTDPGVEGFKKWTISVTPYRYILDVQNVGTNQIGRF